MEVQLELTTNLNKAFVDLKSLKSGMGDLQTKATQTGTAFKTTFSQSEQLTKKNNQTMKDGVTILAQTGEQIRKIGGATTEAATQTKSFRQEILEATLVARQLGQQFGEQSEQAIEARKKVGELRQEFLDFQQSVEAFSPEKKFTVVTQVVAGLSGALSATAGAVTLLGLDSEKTEKAMRFATAFTSITVGLNSVLGLGSAFKNLGAILGITSKAKNASAAATVAETEAEVVNTEVKTANTVATGKAALATTTFGVITAVLTGQMTLAAGAAIIFRNAMNLLLGPVGLILIAITAVVAAIEFFSDAGESFSTTLEKMKQRAEDFDSFFGHEGSFVDQLKAKLEREAKAMEDAGDRRIALLKKNNATEETIQKEQLKNEDALIKKREDNRKRLNKLLDNSTLGEAAGEISALTKENEDIQKKIDAGLSKDDKKAAEEQIKSNKARIDQFKQFIDQQLELDKQAKFDLQEDEVKHGTKVIEVNAEIERKRLELIIKSREALLAAQRDVTAANDDLQKRISGEESGLLTPSARVENQRQQAQEEIDILNKTLIEKARIEAQAQENLAAAQERRQAKVIDFAKLDVAQEEELEKLRLLVDERFAQLIIDARLAEREAVIENTKTGNEKELQLLDIHLKQLAQKLKAQGLTPDQISFATSDARIEGLTEIGQDVLNKERENSKNLIDLIQLSGVEEAQAERIRNEKKLEVDLEFAQKDRQLLIDEFNDLQAIGADTTAVQQAIDAANANIKKLGRAIQAGKDDIAANSKPLSWAAIFGVDEEQAAQFNTQIASFLGSVQQIVLEQQQIRQQEVDEQIAHDQEIINSLNGRVSETESALNQELELQKKGLANNVDLKRRELALLKAERDKAIQDEKKAQDEKAKLAKQEAAIQSAQQAASLITAGANIFESATKTGGFLGVIIAIAGIAAMVAAFLALKSNVAKATTLEKGGLIGGRRHYEGGNKYVSADGQDLMEHEAGEYAVNRKSTNKYFDLIDAINKDKFGAMPDSELFKLLSGTGVTLRKGVSQKLVYNSFQVNRIETEVNKDRMSVMEGELKTLNSQVGSLSEHIKEQEKVETKKDGTIVRTRKRGSIEEVTVIRQQ